MDIIPNTKIGKYTVLKKLGEGASGCVVKAEQDAIHRIVALKILFMNLTKEKPTLLKRFQREARLAAALVHPSIVPIFEIDEFNGTYFYTMQYIDGIMMKEYIKTSSLTLRKKLEIFLHLCSAIALAHEHNIVHRDLKPHNVMMTKDLHPVILDFGIAKSLQDQEQMTRVGDILGSAHYMAPEQAIPDSKIGTFTDVFALGVMIYEVMAGERPFQGKEIKDLILRRAQYLTNPEVYAPARMRTIRPELPEELDDLVFHCLAANPIQRYQNAGEVLESLQSLSASLGFMPMYQKPVTSQHTAKKTKTELLFHTPPNNELQFNSNAEKKQNSPTHSPANPQIINTRRFYVYPFLLSILILSILLTLAIIVQKNNIPELNKLHEMQKSGSSIMKEKIQQLQQIFSK